MPLDSETLSSLRIERSSPSDGGGGKKALIWGGVGLVVIGLAVAAYFLFDEIGRAHV